MSGSSQAAPHAAGLAAILMQKYGTRGEEIRKIMQNQALDIGDPGLFGHGLLQYVSDGFPNIFIVGYSQQAPHEAGLLVKLMQKYGTRVEEILKIMKNQALDIVDPGLFGHGLLHYVSDEEEKNNELAPPEEETETP